MIFAVILLQYYVYNIPKLKMDNIDRIFLQYWEIKSKKDILKLLQCYVYNFTKVKTDKILSDFFYNIAKQNLRRMYCSNITPKLCL